MTKLMTTLILYALLASAFTAFTIGAIAVASAERLDPTTSAELIKRSPVSQKPPTGAQRSSS